jgi:hypothetical protein
MIWSGFSFSLLFLWFDGFDFLVLRKLQVTDIYIFKNLFIFIYLFIFGSCSCCCCNFCK